MTKSIHEEPLVTIIKNVERLIADAQILLDRGSAGSSLSIAILAFEEAGKGHHHELEIGRTKRISSWHVYRQYIAAYVLMVSLFQKYGLEQPKLTDRAHDMLRERSEKAKDMRELAREPIPEELSLEVRKGITGLDELNEDQLLIFSVEQRWVGNVVKAAAQGAIEQMRQKGMYVDVEKDLITSNPSDIATVEAFKWIRIAQRTLMLLKNGSFDEPYGELAAVLERMPKPLPKGEGLLAIMEDFQSVGDTMREEYGEHVN
jgi:AbiV family abortive infection protein